MLLLVVVVVVVVVLLFVVVLLLFVVVLVVCLFVFLLGCRLNKIFKSLYDHNFCQNLYGYASFADLGAFPAAARKMGENNINSNLFQL